MTIGELLTQLKALETAIQARNEYAGELVFKMASNGEGLIKIIDCDYGEVHPHYYIEWNTPAELESVLAAARAEVGAT